jgi:uncharacterized protein YbcV (DUF1398 family)
MDADRVREISSKAKQEKWKFPLKFIALKDAGVSAYKYNLATAESVYEGADGTSFRESHPGLEHIEIASALSSQLIEAAIEDLASEQASFADFCAAAAAAGVINWKVEIEKGVCIYFGKNGSKHIQRIPA